MSTSTQTNHSQSASPLIGKPSLLINGEQVEGQSYLPVINPATGDAFAESPAASLDQLNEAVEAAGRAFVPWAATPLGTRQQVLGRIADAIDAAAEELAQILTAEQGKPLPSALGEVKGTADYIRHFATLTLDPEIFESNETRHVEIHRAPLGVVGAILPWNVPLMLLAFKSPPALLAGNTIVVKPARNTPLTTLRFGELIRDIVPPGVVNIIAGGSELGPALASHPGLRKVTFTGSTGAGKKVMQAAAANLARVTLELGGNDPAIVLPDVDLSGVVEKIFASAFGNSGQVCRAVKRVYVHRDIYDEFCDRIAERAKNAVVGNGMENGVDFGPVQNKQQFEHLQVLLAEAEKLGTVLPGGGVVDGPGFFVRPTVVRDMPDDSQLVADEQFGPILPVLPFEDLEDAISRANSGPYGLAASVWSSDMEAAYAIAGKIEAGTVWINKHMDRSGHLPIAGAKQSGIGVELGAVGLLEYTQYKMVNASQP